MQIKSYVIEQNISKLNKNINLFFGENLGLKSELKKKLHILTKFESILFKNWVFVFLAKTTTKFTSFPFHQFYSMLEATRMLRNLLRSYLPDIPDLRWLSQS